MSLIVTTLLALGLRLLSLRMQGTGWLDELFSLHFASASTLESWLPAFWDVHPPFFHLVLTSWLWVVGDSLSAARLLSVLCGTAVVPAVWLVTREIGGRWSAAVAATLVAISPVLIYLSGEARMYSLLTLLVSLSLWLFVRAWRSDFSRRSLLVWSLVAAAALLTHLTVVVPFAIMVVWGFWRSNGPARRRLVIAVVGMIIPFLAWLVPVIKFRSAGFGNEWQFGTNGGVLAAVGVFSKLFAHGTSEVSLWLIGLFAAVLMIVAFRSLRRQTGDRPRIAELYTLLAIAPFVVFAPLGWSTVKYYLVALPAVLALTAVGGSVLVRFFRSSRRTIVGFIIVVVFLSLILSSLWQLVSVRRIRWDGAMHFIETQEHVGDMIFAEWFVSELPIREYYRGSLPVASGYAYDETLNFNERLVRYSGSAVAGSEMLTRMERDIGETERVFLVTGEFQPAANPVQGWFVDHGWRLDGIWLANKFSPTVLLFSRPK
ncbi:hypothetical protein A2480_02840 [Candidatus Uhrbacteria bacterium RIFOXYC2_FULL_47_19]|uniref:Glycosyltransferase RgtA/B/C/D-like domain-containing protein n=1 Tax=Candidatus Uhrbacteria bacterium RIFOXYC2_FULL_47_19 TaxID=1802424 RepID=A0A1F7WGA4_9BACT|nr:MAG: hypothetical protein A2480_02840 [Candidatus Uhrbacteria bacterium RIFOXYC2_FULL_47_19]